VKSHMAHQDHQCSMCLFGSKISISGDAVYYRELITEGETSYHIVCANMWLNLVGGNLPLVMKHE